MKKINFMLSLLLLWVVGAVSVGAKDIITDNYEELFSDKINASDPEFSPAIGWGHYTWGFEKNANGDLFHPTYTWGKDLTIDGVDYPYIQVATQTGKDAYNDYQTDKDMLITPVIYGTSSFYAQAVSYDYFLHVYKMKEEKGKWVPDGDPFVTFTDNVSRWSAKKLEIPEVDGVRLGIYGSCIKIGRFAAEQAAIPETKKLSFQNVSSIDRYANANADGNYTVSVTATVVNSGNLDLTAADAPTVTLVDSKGNVLATEAIDGDFAVGATKDVQLSFTRSYAEYPDEETISLAENIGNTKYVVGSYVPVSVEPKFVIVEKGETNALGADSNLYFGKTRSKVYKHFVITNDGGSTLNITGVDLPEGFTSTIDAETGLAVEPHTSQEIDLILSDEIVGVHEGVAKFNAGALTKTINVKGELMPETKWAATFENKKLPAGSHCESESSYYAWSIDTYHKSSSIWATDNDRTSLSVSSSSKESKFVTPRLKFDEGETFEFDAAQNCGTFDEGKYGLSVYYSADGTTWQLARTISPSELPNDKSNYYYKPVRFIVDNIPAGSWFIGISAAKADIDNLAGGTLDPDPHSWTISETDVPTTGEVNSAYTASVTIKNTNSVDDPGTYDVNLIVDGEVVGTTPGVKIVADETSTVAVSYTPHATGAVKAKIEVVANDADYTLTTDESDVTIKEEIAINDVQAGNVEDDNAHAPFYLYNEKNESEILYPASKLSGLKKGDKIAKITFRAKTSYTLNFNDVKVWMQNTEDEAVATPFEAVSTDDMTQVFDGELTFTSPDNKGDVFGDYIVIDLATPFVYDGNGLRLHLTQHLSKGYGKSGINFEVEKDKTLAYNRNCYNSGTIEEKSYEAACLPVAHFGVALDPVQYNGVVEDRCQNGIDGAGVTYKSGDVEYYALTDEDGKYTVNVVKSNLDYNATIEAPGYDAIEDASIVGAEPTWKMEISPVTLDKGEMYYCASADDMTEEDLDEASDEYTVYELTKVADGKAVFNRVTTMEKYKTYLIVSKVDDNETDIDDGDVDLALGEEFSYRTADGSAISSTSMYRVKLSPITSGFKIFRLDDGKFKAVDFNNDNPADVLLEQYTYPMEAVILASADVDELDVELDDEPTGITTVNADKANKGVVYNVEGMQVSKAGTKGLKPGLYIVNGKKVVKK